MESRTKNRKTREQVTRMVNKAFGGAKLADSGDALTELKEGWFNAAYNVRLDNDKEVILKIAPPREAEILTYEKDIMITEVESMRLAAKNPAIPVPEIYYFDTDRDLCDSYYFFMEKLSGDNLGHIRESLSPEEQAEIDRSIGGIIHELNGFTGTYFGYEGNSDLRADTWKEAFQKIVDSVLEDGRKKNAEYGFTIEDIRDTVLKHSGMLASVTTPCLVHWDAWDLNFFVKDGKISGILDFERALWADPLMEAQFRPYPQSITESMRGYGKTTFSYDETVRCILYTLHLALVMKTECYYRNYDTDEVSNIAMGMLTGTMKWLQEN